MKKTGKVQLKPEVDSRLVDNLREIALLEDDGEQQIVRLSPPAAINIIILSNKTEKLNRAN